MSEEKKSPEKKTASEPKRAPLEWAKELGHKKKHGRGKQARVLLSAQYAAANALYGWSLQAHHWGADSFQLTEKDFTAAMEAASKYPTARPHEPAIPEVCKEKFAGFQPLKAHKD